MTVEEQFGAFRQSCKPAEFNSVAFLINKAKELEDENKPLSNRILVRVNHLKKQQAKQRADERAQSEKTTVPTQSAMTPSEPNKSESKKPITWQENLQEKGLSYLKTPFTLFVLLPALVFSLYQVLWATERFESTAQVIVKQPDAMATMDAGMALLSGLGVPSGGSSDNELVKAYIYSADMLAYLDDKLKLFDHFTDTNVDYFSRLSDSDSQEDFLKFYQSHVELIINDASGVISISAQGFTPEFSHLLVDTITNKAEWFINSIGHQLAEAQLTFIANEFQIVEGKLQKAQSDLQQFQQQYDLLDPLAEGLAKQQITYTLEGQLSAKEAELKGLESVMSARAPQVLSTKTQIAALHEQLKRERQKLAEQGVKDIPVSEIIRQYTDLKINLELALQAYTASQVSLEKSRVEAYRQLKYLITVQKASKPQDNKYPDVLYNISLFLLLASLLFGIVKIVMATIRELK